MERILQKPTLIKLKICLFLIKFSSGGLSSTHAHTHTENNEACWWDDGIIIIIIIIIIIQEMRY
jgi:hypothetical protein